MSSLPRQHDLYNVFFFFSFSTHTTERMHPVASNAPDDDEEGRFLFEREEANHCLVTALEV